MSLLAVSKINIFSIYLDDIPSSNTHINHAESFHTTNSSLKEIHDYIHILDDKLTQMNNLITDDLMDRTIYLKNTVEGAEENSIKRLSENFTLIKELLSEHSMQKIEILDKFKEKILSNILQMQQYYGLAMSEFVDGKNIYYFIFSSEYNK
jgi:hypothetical protein